MTELKPWVKMKTPLYLSPGEALAILECVKAYDAHVPLGVLSDHLIARDIESAIEKMLDQESVDALVRDVESAIDREIDNA